MFQLIFRPFFFFFRQLLLFFFGQCFFLLTILLFIDRVSCFFYHAAFLFGPCFFLDHVSFLFGPCFFPFWTVFLFFLQGQISATFMVPIYNDNLLPVNEAQREVEMSLSLGGGGTGNALLPAGTYVLSPSTAHLGIRESTRMPDSIGRIGFAASSVSATESAREVMLVVERKGGSSGAVVVRFVASSEAGATALACRYVVVHDAPDYSYRPRSTQTGSLCEPIRTMLLFCYFVGSFFLF